MAGFSGLATHPLGKAAIAILLVLEKHGPLSNEEIYRLARKHLAHAEDRSAYNIRQNGIVLLDRVGALTQDYSKGTIELTPQGKEEFAALMSFARTLVMEAHRFGENNA